MARGSFFFPSVAPDPAPAQRGQKRVDPAPSADVKSCTYLASDRTSLTEVEKSMGLYFM